MYQKYKADYGVEDILQGKPFDTVLDRALNAAFDERMSLVSLLLAGLNTRFAQARRTDAATDACYQQLRSFKRALAAGSDDPVAIFTAQCNAYENQLEAGKAAGRLVGEEAAAQSRAAALMRDWGKKLDAGMDGDEAFDTVRTGFNAQVRRREQDVATAGDALEFAFDFMERAFADSQEMVVFVNELALGPDSAAFLAENECERFDKYSRSLLLNQKQDELMAELERDDLRRSEGSLAF